MRALLVLALALCPLTAARAQEAPAPADPADELAPLEAPEAADDPVDDPADEPEPELQPDEPPPEAPEAAPETAADPADEAEPPPQEQATEPPPEASEAPKAPKRLEAPDVPAEAAQPDQPDEPDGGLQQLGEFFTSGKAELLATGTVYGGYLGTLALVDAGFVLFQLLQFPAPWELQPVGLGALFLSPIAGGALGLGLGALTYSLWPEMTAGDANLLRSSLWLGAFNSAVLGILSQGYGSRTFPDWWRLGGASVTTAMLAGALVTPGAATALALLTDLPEAAGPLGLSLGAWSGTLAVLGQLMFDLPLRFEEGTLLVGAVANAGYAAGLLASPFVPLTRFETWLLDLGAVAGGLLGTALVLGLRAPNPVLGYGGIGVGLVLGAGTGVALGKLVPLGLELVELPTLVAMGPLMLPPGRPGAPPPLGAQVSLRLDARDLLDALHP